MRRLSTATGAILIPRSSPPETLTGFKTAPSLSSQAVSGRLWQGYAAAYLSAEQSIPGSSDVFKDWAEIVVAAPGRNAENFPAALPENAIAPDVLASELTSNVDVVIAVDLDVELNPFVEQREVQFIAGDIEFGIGLEAGVPHALENKLLRPTVRPEVRDGGRRLLLRLYFVAQIGSERTQRGYAELIDFRVSDYDEGSPGAADGYVD